MNFALANPLPRLSPMGAHMLDCEAREGRTPIMPGNAPDWLNADDWNPWPVLAVANGELHIIAVNAARKGALTRLIAGARSAGLSPVIVEPMGPAMPGILAKWGWKRRAVGTGFYAREEWRPA